MDCDPVEHVDAIEVDTRILIATACPPARAITIPINADGMGMGAGFASHPCGSCLPVF